MQPTHLVRFLSKTNTQEFMAAFVKAEGQEGLFSVIDVHTKKVIGLWDKKAKQYIFNPEYGSNYVVENLAFRCAK